MKDLVEGHLLTWSILCLKPENVFKRFCNIHSHRKFFFDETKVIFKNKLKQFEPGFYIKYIAEYNTIKPR